MIIPVVFSADNNYTQHLGVSMISLFENKNKETSLIFYILDGGISKNNKKKLNQIARSYQNKIKFIQINDEILKNIKSLKIHSHFTIPTYFRLLIPKIINEEKIIYLDCDTIVQKDLSNLFKIKLEDKAIGAVEALSKEDNLKRKPEIKKIYVNTGVMLIDCHNWNKFNITEKTIKFAQLYPNKLESVDQDAINYTCQDYIKTIDRKYNAEVRQPKNKFKKYNLDINDIHIIHYIGGVKPWHFLYYGPFKKIYKKYLKKTPWKYYKYPDKTIKNIVIKITYQYINKKAFKLIKRILYEWNF